MAKQLPQINFKDINIRRFLFVRRFLLLSIVMGVVTLAIVLFAVIPQLQQIFQTQGTIQQENVVLKNLQRKIQGLAQVNDLEEYAHKDAVDQALPLQKPLLQLLENSRIVSGDSGARIVSIETAPGKLATVSAQKTPASVTTDGTAIVSSAGQVHGVDKMDIQVTVEGNINQISDFIRRIELTTPITNVTQINLTDSAKPSTDGTAEFSADLRLSSYYFTRAIQVAIDAPLPETGVKERTFLQSLDKYTVASNSAQSQTVEGGGREDLFGVGTTPPLPQ